MRAVLAILAAVGLLLAPARARAAPAVYAVAQYVAGAAAAYGASAAAAYAIYTATAMVLKTIILQFALGKVSKALFGKKAGSGTPSSQTLMIRSTKAPREIVYGEVRKSGVLVFQGVSGSSNRFLWYVLAVAGHQVDSITDVWLGPTKITNAQINAGTGEVTAGDYAGKVYIWKQLGTDAQTAQSDLDGAFSAITSNHRGRGVALLVIRLEHDAEVFEGGAPAEIFCTVKGKKVYDPRLDSTNGGSGSHRLADATTWAWSDNAALCTADYITGGSLTFDVTTPRNILGMRVPSARVRWALVIAAANKCDELVAIPGSTTQKRYRVNGVLSCANTHEDNLDAIIGAMFGNRVFTGGAYSIFAGAYDTPSESLTDTDLGAAGYKVQGALTGNDVYNQVSAAYFDPNRGWQENTCYVRTDATFESDDGKPILRNISLPMVTNEYQAQRICEVAKQQSRNQITVELNCKLSALRIAPWDTFYLTLEDMGWVDVVFRATVIEVDFSARSVRITGRSESAAAYADLLDSEYGAAGSASAARFLAARAYVQTDNLIPGSAATVFTDAAATDTFTAGAWSSSAGTDGDGVSRSLVHDADAAVEITVVAQVEVTTYTAPDTLIMQFQLGGYTTIHGSMDPQFPITGLGTFDVSISRTVLGSDAAGGSVYSYPTLSVSGNTVVVRSHVMRCTVVKR